MVKKNFTFQVGFESHAHRVTSDKMAETPEEVLRFLQALSEGVRDKAEQEVREREKERARRGRRQGSGGACVRFFAWIFVFFFGGEL